ncbi:hypothetical protein LUZ62_035476 [Rhynchospora pubera]|uniref:Uncharacterized protein n=1 Tax=Rhynchospora pubera TaxID=906938 RepID=A0AAV8EXT8_9POAL|nr:hypothetical protein LUZ62_035476 [Rhynchospora pubera]
MIFTSLTETQSPPVKSLSSLFFLPNINTPLFNLRKTKHNNKTKKKNTPRHCSSPKFSLELSMFLRVACLNSSISLRVPNSNPAKRGRVSPIANCMQIRPPNFENPEGGVLIAPDFPSNDPLSINPVKFDLKSISSPSTVPLSLRFVQLRKKHANLSLPKTAPDNLCPLGNMIFSLASVIAEAQRSRALDSSAVDSEFSIVWLFQKVFASSSALTLGVFDLMGDFMDAALNEIHWVLADLEWQKITAKGQSFKSWSEVGVTMEDEAMIGSDFEIMCAKRKEVYLKLIEGTEACSMVLSNYAQFLYQIEKDYESAEDYFVRSLAAEPIDGGARIRYANFLWQHKGDLENAEQMFLEALDVDHGNDHHLCAYARFLWMTGGQEVCIVNENEA